MAGLFGIPDMKEMIKAQQKIVLGPMIDKMFSGWFTGQTAITPEQTAQLKELIQKKMSIGAEMGLSLLDDSLDAAKRAEIGKQIKTESDAIDAQIKDMLGEDDYKAFQKYEGTTGDRVFSDSSAIRCRAQRRR